MASHREEVIISASARRTAAFMAAFLSAEDILLMRAFADFDSFKRPPQAEQITRATKLRPMVAKPATFMIGC